MIFSDRRESFGWSFFSKMFAFLPDEHVFLCIPSHQSIIRWVEYHLDSSMLLDGRGSNARWSCDWTKNAIIRNRRQLYLQLKRAASDQAQFVCIPGTKLTDCCVRFFLSHLRVSDDDDVRWFVIKTHSSKWVIQHGRHIGSGWFLPVAQNLITWLWRGLRTTTSFAKCWRKHLVGTCYLYNFEELLNCALFKII